MTPRAALDRALAALEREAPQPVGRGRRALERALGWTARTRWPEVAWQFSPLADGVPVELVWRPGRPGLFWTAEPAAPEWSGARCLTRALALLRSIDGGLPCGLRSAARDVLAHVDEPWPVWAAGRHDARGDASKLYVLCRRVPPGAERAAPLLRADDRPMMLGLAHDGGREFYWARPTRIAGDLWRLCADREIEPLARALDAALADWTGGGFDDESGSRLGLSLALDAASRVIALAVFMRVSAAGGADCVRRRLLACGGDANPALAQLWADGHLRPLLLTLGATRAGTATAIGLRIV
ncbi:MAG: hypothetical protein AB7F22_10325 [Reyranella sp.]|uniref:hypothetical protein n=1 Tax=Reyranella sp. TaxID=1929291 RepID=UPI003D12FDD7